MKTIIFTILQMLGNGLCVSIQKDILKFITKYLILLIWKSKLLYNACLYKDYSNDTTEWQ